MSVLVVDFAAEAYAARLRRALDGVTVRAAQSFVAAEPHYDDAEVVVTMGVPVHGLLLTPEIVERMPRLGFVQSLLAGTDSSSARSPAATCSSPRRAASTGRR